MYVIGRAKVLLRNQSAQMLVGISGRKSMYAYPTAKLTCILYLG